MSRQTKLPAEPFLAGFAGHEQALKTSGPAWLRTLRETGAARFRQLGFPTTREEAWKVTNVAPIAKTAFLPAPDGTAVGALSELPEPAGIELGGARLVFVNGRYAPSLSRTDSLPGAVWVGSLAEALETIPERVRPRLERPDATGGLAFQSLNDAMLQDGAVVLIPDDLDLDAPIHLQFCSARNGQPSASWPRTLIAAGRGSRVRVVESYYGTSDEVYLTSAETTIDVGDNASVEHCRLQLEGGASFHISGLTSRQGRDSRLVSHNIDLGARLARHDTTSVLDGEGADCRLNGLYQPRDGQHVDNQTVLDHARPHGASRELYKGILQGASRSMFNGRIIVRQDAQQTDAVQTNPNLLLSESALAHTRPQLEIYADDVKCTHAATIGRLDEEAIFYLRSRAIGRAEARNLLVNAFAAEVLDDIGIEPVRDYLTRTVADRLSLAR